MKLPCLKNRHPFATAVVTVVVTAVVHSLTLFYIDDPNNMGLNFLRDLQIHIQYNTPIHSYSKFILKFSGKIYFFLILDGYHVNDLGEGHVAANLRRDDREDVPGVAIQ